VGSRGDSKKKKKGGASSANMRDREEESFVANEKKKGQTGILKTTTFAFLIDKDEAEQVERLIDEREKERRIRGSTGI